MSGDPADSKSQLLKSWNEETDFVKRNAILQQMTEQGLFPAEEEADLETTYGIYPDLPDPQAKLYNHDFLKKLLRKQEFIEDRQASIQSLFAEGDEMQDLLELLESDASACGAYTEGKETSEESIPSITPFELSPTQRFIGRFLSPQLPYNSALLFHGVGVGKTCSGITVAENFLQMFPKKQVFIIAPPTIQAGWMREIFTLRKLILGKKNGEPNVHNGCTGNTYLRLAAVEYERDPDVIERKVREVIKRRYKIMGYLQFYNYVTKYIARFVSREIKDKERYNQEKSKYLMKKFSGSMIIVDEAHNLRDKETEIVPVATAATATVTAPPRPPVEEKNANNVNVSSEFARSAEEEVNLASVANNEAPNNEEEVNLASVTGNAAPNLVQINEQKQGENDENNENEVDLASVPNNLGNQVQEGGADDDEEDEEDEIDLEDVSEGPKEVLAGEDADSPLAPEDKADIVKGKKMTPLLREVLIAADGMKFLMLTATPMYNEYKEIIVLLNLLLLNDKRATIRESQIFTPEGEFASGGRELLGRIASSYLSFMRGENPLAFPIRLNPLLEESQKVTVWPSRQPDGKGISEAERRQVINLPYVACPVPGENVAAFQALCQDIISKEKLTIPSTDKLIMAGNFLYPGEDESMELAALQQKVGKTGFRRTFLYEDKVFKPLTDSNWMLAEYEDFAPPLEFHSPKAKYVVDRVKTTRGVCFAYSRFVETGALTLALILEANGYTCASRKNLLNIDSPPDGKGRQCALCSLRETEHKPHEFQPEGFVPAKYVLLTGEKDYSPNNKKAIELATDPNNFDGKLVKVILGSTIASEGIDLKFIRELFVFDSWYHLSKLEQVIGRGIRYKSHCALPPLERNCTINLLVLTYPQADNLESIDMYQYRNGFLKARQVGQVTRVLKEYALDCNLNKELILIQGLNPIRQIDGQGVERDDVDVNDTPYTNICDWLETCEYKCKPDLDLDTLEIDYSSYDEYAAKWREHEIKQRIRKIFEDQPFLHFDDIQNKILADIPRVAKAAILDEIVGNRSFRIRVGDQEGYILYKNGIYLFQPELLWDTNLPLALRIADFPVKRDSYEPIPIEKAVAKPLPKAVTKVEEVVGNNKKEEALPPEVQVEVEEEEEVTQYKEFWNEVVKWSNTIKNNTASKDTPRAIDVLIRSRYLALGDKTIDSIIKIYEMVGRLYISIRGNEALRNDLADVLLEFVWDEYLTTSEIQALVKLGTPEILLASSENRLSLGSKSIFRFVDPTTKKIVYMCDGKLCEQSIVDGAEGDDPISKLKADNRTTTLLYGLNAAKDGKILFKSNDAVDPSAKKPGIGRLCYSVPNTTVHYKLLDMIGKMAAIEIGTDLDLLEEKTGTVKTPAKLCTLADLAFRLIDKANQKEEGRKRAFYRPISAVKTKHEGKASK
jgi:hypothetical protein